MIWRKGKRSLNGNLQKICLQTMAFYYLTYQVKVCIMIAVCLVVIILFWNRKNDPCQGKDIIKNLCQEFKRKEVSGHLCYRLCVENNLDLSRCISDGEHFKSFLVNNNLLIRASVSLLNPKTQLKLAEGISIQSFSEQSNAFLNSKLGISKASADFQYLTDQLLLFADFNENDQLSFGEVQSLWHLMNIEEFLLLFLFRNQPAVPNIMTTCGSLYGFQYHSSHFLYDANKSHFPASLFQNSYRWGMSAWHNRVKVVVGMLRLVDDLAEVEGVEFFLCNTQPTLLGYTDQHEFLLRDLSKLKSAKVLHDILSNKTCVDNEDCIYTRQCISTCDKSRGKCDGDIISPTLWFICDIIQEYLLFDSPYSVYYDLKHYLSKCMDIQPGNTQFSIFLEDFRRFLWHIIQI